MGLASFRRLCSLSVVNPSDGRLFSYSEWNTKFSHLSKYVKELALYTPDANFRFSLNVTKECTYSQSKDIAYFHSASLPTIAQCFALYKCFCIGFLDDVFEKFGGFKFTEECLWTRDLDWDEQFYPQIGFVYKPGGCIFPASVDLKYSCLEVRDLAQCY